MVPSDVLPKDAIVNGVEVNNFVIHGLPMWRVDDSGRVYAHTPIRSM